MKPTRIILIIAAMLFAAAVASSCGNKHNSQTETDMHKFAPKFPQKTVWIHHGGNDSTAITFSSMEEAEWKLVHNVMRHDFYDAFVQVLLSDPSSMGYPFDSLSNEHFCRIFPLVVSDDGNVRFIGLEPEAAHQVPHMIVQYRINNEVRVAEEGFPSDNCYYCLAPDTVFSFSIGESTLYLVSGYIGYTGHGHCYGLMAYELDAKDFHPAFVFHTDTSCADYLWEQHTLNMEICFNADTVSGKDLFYFDKNKSTIYVREIANKEMVEKCGCITKITDRYWKCVWNGKEFVESGFVHKKL